MILGAKEICECLKHYILLSLSCYMPTLSELVYEVFETKELQNPRIIGSHDPIGGHFCKSSTF